MIEVVRTVERAGQLSTVDAQDVVRKVVVLKMVEVVRTTSDTTVEDDDIAVLVDKTIGVVLGVVTTFALVV